MARHALHRAGLLAASACLLALAALPGCTEDARTEGLRTPAETNYDTPYDYNAASLAAAYGEAYVAYQASAEAFSAIGPCARGQGAHSSLRSSDGKDIAAFEDELGSVVHDLGIVDTAVRIDHSGARLSRSLHDIIADARRMVPDAKRFAIDCGVLTPQMMAEPDGDTNWWDYSSGDGSYTPPGYSPPH